MKYFDLKEHREKADGIVRPEQLFHLWDGISYAYERGELSEFEYREMKKTIYPKLKSLTSLKLAVEGSFDRNKKAS